MAGGSKIVGIRPPHQDEGASKSRGKSSGSRAATVTAEMMEIDEAPASRLGFRLLNIGAVLAALAWTGSACWTFWTSLNGATPDLPAVISFLATLSTPLVLIAVIWALILRSQAGQTHRFTTTVSKLRHEEARLAATLADMARRIDANRMALAEQANLMATIGEETADRLNDVSLSMQGQVEAINRHAATLEARTSHARSDMTGLLADVPQAHAEVNRMAELLDATGQNAMTSANALAAQLALLAERGRNADDIAARSALHLAERVASLDDMTRIAAARMEEASAATVTAVETVLDRAAAALAETRADLEAQGNATVSMIETSHAAITASGVEATSAVADRVAQIAASIEKVSQVFAAQDTAAKALLDRLNSEITALEGRFAGLEDQSQGNVDRAAAALQGLKQQADQLTGALDQGGKTADALITQAETLLTALDASVREIDETLPLAHQRLQETAAASRKAARDTMPEITALETASSAALDRLRDAETLVTAQRDLIDRTVQSAGAAIEQSRATAEALSRELDAAEEQAKSLTGTAAPQLIDALLRIKDTAQQAAEHARTALDNVVPEAAHRLGAEARDALEAALSGPVEDQMALIAERAEQAIAAARKAVGHLTTEVANIDAAALGLEQRIDDAKDEAVRGDKAQFARRMARIIDALNSNAISVSKILSEEVSQTAWGAYLRGERGIFTRQAVRLLSGSEARELRRLYQDDDAFRDLVNLYVHDFEAMLRNVLATRDGDPLSVTLISSDAGKLYVALAQAIERLR